MGISTHLSISAGGPDTLITGLMLSHSASVGLTGGGHFDVVVTSTTVGKSTGPGLSCHLI